MSCSIGFAEVVFLEMGEKFVENDFSRILDRNRKLEMEQKFFKRFLSSDGFFNRGLTTAVF